MNETYKKLADGFRQLAEGYLLLANEGESAAQPAPAAPEDAPPPKVTIEQVRAVLASKSQDGKTRQVKSLLLKYDAGKLSGVKPEDYPALLREAEAL